MVFTKDLNSDNMFLKLLVKCCVSSASLFRFLEHNFEKRNQQQWLLFVCSDLVATNLIIAMRSCSDVR